MILYKTLETTSLEVLHQTFIEAFSDYQIKMNLPFYKFQQMLMRREYDASLSIGAFKDDELVGFTLTGLRNWNNQITAYNISTAVVPAYRKKGITSTIFTTIKEMLEKKGVKQYLLEVLDTNEPAINLYQKQGFSIQREFICLQMERKDCKVNTILDVEIVNVIDFKLLEKSFDFQPSWQNSIDSINAVADSFIYFIIRDNDAILGYGVLDPDIGDIPQLFVFHEDGENEIVSSIIAKMFTMTKVDIIKTINIDKQSETYINKLYALGFKKYVGQYEMVLTLGE
ncbi:MAG: GNAT family N-acetyltransferase [Coprobacillaceae bacterium]